MAASALSIAGDAYLVGLFDGEGCISPVRSTSGRSYVHVQVTIASEAVVRRFERRFGGAVTVRQAPTVGGLTLWIWRVTGHAAREALGLFAELSLTKHEQAALALRLLDLTAPGGGRGTYTVPHEVEADRERLADEIRALNGGRSRFAELTA